MATVKLLHICQLAEWLATKYKVYNVHLKKLRIVICLRGYPATRHNENLIYNCLLIVDWFIDGTYH